MTNKSKEKEYQQLVERMVFDKTYTAAELGVASATMTALVNRKLVEKFNTTPRTYKRIGQLMPQFSATLEQILNIMKNYPEGTNFSICKENFERGILCCISGGDVRKVYDYMNKADLKGITHLFVKGKKHMLN